MVRIRDAFGSRMRAMLYFVLLRPKTKLSRREQNRLKAAIRKRLRTENYTCRLPKPAKPRVRYRLQMKRHHFKWVWK